MRPQPRILVEDGNTGTPAIAGAASNLLLADLLGWTPSAAMKRRASWSSLSEATMTELLLELERRHGFVPDDLVVLAAQSGSAYIRYLAARSRARPGPANPEVERTHARLDADPIELVAYARYERAAAWVPGDALRAPHGMRLAMLRSARPPGMEQFALYLLQAHQARVAPAELVECLLEFLGNEAVHARAQPSAALSGRVETRCGATRPLWPLFGRLSLVFDEALAAALPAPESDADEQALERAIRDLPDERLALVLRRVDFALPRLRRAVFLAEPPRSPLLLHAAAAAIELSDDELGAIIAHRRHLLPLLVRSAALDPIHLAALHDTLLSERRPGTDKIAAVALDTLMRQLRMGSEAFRAETRLRLQWFDIARRAASGRLTAADAETLDDDLRGCIVAGSPWESYRAIHEALRREASGAGSYRAGSDDATGSAEDPAESSCEPLAEASPSTTAEYSFGPGVRNDAPPPRAASPAPRPNADPLPSAGTAPRPAATIVRAMRDAADGPARRPQVRPAA